MSLMALGFVIVFFIGCSLAIFKSPIFGLYTYLLVFYLSPSTQWWGNYLPSLRWSLFAGIITLVAVIIKRETVEYAWYSFKETKIFILFTIFVIIQSFWALSFELHSVYLFLCVKFIILFIIIQSSIKNINDLYGFILVNAIGCAYLGYQGISGGRLENLGTSGIDDSNLLAQHLSTVLVFSSFLLIATIKRKYLLFPIIVLILNGVILTESRTSIISLAFTGVITVFYLNQSAKKPLYIYGVLALVAFSVLLGPGLVKKWSTVVTDSDRGIVQDKSAASRVVIIDAQLEMFSQQPLIGYGHRGTLLLSPLYVPSENLNQSGIRASHSLIMSLLVDHGLIGTTLYLTIIFLCVKKLLYLKKLKINETYLYNLNVVLFGLIAALINLMVAGLGSNNKVLEIDIWLYATIPLVFRMIRKAKDNRA